MDNIISLFHCNEDTTINVVMLNINEIDLLRSFGNKDWLGTGIYFWDNLGNAKYWKRDKERKDKEKKYSILRVGVCLDNALNLTDPDVGKQFNNIINKISEIDPIIQKGGFGKKIDFLSRKSPEIMGNYEVIIADVYYAKQTNRIFKNMRSYLPRLTDKNKRIYNVIKNDAIVEVLGKEVDLNE
ncbi:hypothetical protein [Peptoniphilus sp. Marseille-Q6390]